MEISKPGATAGWCAPDVLFLDVAGQMIAYPAGPPRPAVGASYFPRWVSRAWAWCQEAASGLWRWRR